MVHGQHIILSLPCPFHLGSTAGLAYNVVSHLLNIWRGTITREWCGKPGLVIISLSHSRKGSKTARFSLWQHNAGLSDWPLFPDHHLPPATLLLVLTSLLFLLSLLLCLPLPAVPSSHYTFLGPILCPEVWEKEGEAAVLIFQGYSCLSVLVWKYLPRCRPPGTTVQEHTLS